jgi:hypothetical protein
MAQTVIGFFDDATEAQTAIERLERIGISRDHIDVSRGNSGITGVSGSNTGSEEINPVSGSERDENSVRRTSDGRTVDEAGRNTNKFTDFFNNLFGGSKNDDADRYSRVASESNTIVTVHAQSKDEAEAAADILDDAGAIDVDERSSQYGYTSSQRTGEGENLSSERMRMRSRIVENRVEDRLRLRNRDSEGSTGYDNATGGDRGVF